MAMTKPSSDQIAYLPAGVGAIVGTVEDKLRESVSVKDFGAKGDGVSLINPVGTDDTVAIQAALDSGKNIHFPPGFYNISTITFNLGATYTFDGAYLVCGATTATTAGVVIKCWNANFYNIKVHLNWNTNYTTGIWWYNAEASSQYINIFGIEIVYGYRGMVYGALPGNTSTGFAQSENQIYGWRTRGVQNPFYGNHYNGVLFFSEPIFVALNEEWAGWAPSKVFSWATADAFNNQAGVVVVHGGEIQKSGSALGYGAVLNQCRFIGTVIETAGPILITGSEVWMDSCRHWMTNSGQSQYVFGAWVNAGTFNITKSKFYRAAGVGAYDRTSLIDASAANSSNVITLKDCNLEEWYHCTVTVKAPLINGGTPRYVNTRVKMTAADADIYYLDNTRESLVENRAIDHLGYQTTGWYLVNDYGGGTSFSIAADSPSGYLASSLELNAAGNARIIMVDETSATTIRNTAFRVRPGELYTLESWVKAVSGSNNVQLTTKFYTAAGVALTAGPNGNGEYFVADYAGIGSLGTAWGKVFAMVTIPATAAFMAVGLRCNTSVGRVTDVRLRRAS